MTFPLTAYKKKAQSQCVNTDRSAWSRAQKRNVLAWCLLLWWMFGAKGVLQGKDWQAVLLRICGLATLHSAGLAALNVISLPQLYFGISFMLTALAEIVSKLFFLLLKHLAFMTSTHKMSS